MIVADHTNVVIEGLAAAVAFSVETVAARRTEAPAPESPPLNRHLRCLRVHSLAGDQFMATTTPPSARLNEENRRQFERDGYLCPLPVLEDHEVKRFLFSYMDY